MREIVYPDYKAEVTVGGDIRMRFSVPGAQRIDVILVAPDAAELVRQIDKALAASDQILTAETHQIETLYWSETRGRAIVVCSCDWEYEGKTETDAEAAWAAHAAGQRQ